MRKIYDIATLTEKCMNIGLNLPHAGAYAYPDIKKLIELKSTLASLLVNIFEGNLYRNYVLRHMDWSATYFGDVDVYLTQNFKGIRFSSKTDIYLICQFETPNDICRLVVPFIHDNIGFGLHGIIGIAELSHFIEAQEYGYIIQSKKSKKEVKHLLKFSHDRTKDIFTTSELFSLTRLEDTLLVALTNFNVKRIVDELSDTDVLELSLLRAWTKIMIDADSQNRSGYFTKSVEVDSQFQSFSTFSEWAHNQGYISNRNIQRIDKTGNYSPDNCYVDLERSLFPFNVVDLEYSPSPERYYTLLNEKLTVPRTHFLSFPITINNETKSLTDWETESGINMYLIASRYFYGMKDDQLIQPEEDKIEYTNRIIKYQDKFHTVKEWSEITGISMKTIISRIRYGWKDEDLFAPPQIRTTK